MKKGKIIIMSGPSGSGKTTLSNKLLASRIFKGKIVKSISTTTRSKRPGERHGRDYLFISRQRFLYKKHAGHFLESQKVFDNYYGTPKNKVLELLKAGKNVLLCIDVKGAKVVRRQYPQAMTIFLKVPSLAVLRKRLARRGTEQQSTLALRLRIAHRELKEARYYKHIVINDDLELAYKKIKNILCKELQTE
ncbi:MAG: guanylate kinase [Omnitrophica WOR_2 bacterium RIFCSPHIGHO2_01_FULL_48_9]|nr:MAG: guanylate kinase [Omnitrophica WOR_2 bacterium RIFCSPHIGHO2_02_FULL_48_11]OGX30948.1 MAG: guanylate kinase [Omnitrophica WOR_2 bacterium RIFCSPHIGHO2_01_FULL_48_9]